MAYGNTCKNKRDVENTALERNSYFLLEFPEAKKLFFSERIKAYKMNMVSYWKRSPRACVQPDVGVEWEAGSRGLGA